MELSEFTFRIILIFVPGLISFLIIDKLTIHKEFKVHQIRRGEGVEGVEGSKGSNLSK